MRIFIASGLALLAIGEFRTARADVVSYSKTVLIESLDCCNTFLDYYFNPALGELNSVTFTFVGGFTSALTVLYSDPPQAGYYSATLQATVGLFGYSDVLPPSHTLADVIGGGAKIVSDAQAVNISGILPTSPFIAASAEQAETPMPFGDTPYGGAIISMFPPGNIDEYFDSGSTGSGVFTVNYSFTPMPEPASISVLSIAAAAIATARRRRNRTAGAGD